MSGGVSSGVETSIVVETEVAETAGVAETTVSVASETTVGGRIARLVVRGNGLAGFDFGAPAEEVISELTSRLGAPTEDSGWLEQQAPCDGMGEKSRSLLWPGLYVNFSNGPTEYAPAGSEHFISWSSFEGDASIPGGLMPVDGQPLYGATFSSLKTRYPAAETFQSEIEGPVYTLGDGISGGLTEASDTGTVTSLRAGLVCID